MTRPVRFLALLEMTIKTGFLRRDQSAETRACIMAGVIEVDLFDEDVNDPDHPEVVKFKHLLLKVAEEHHCRLLFFEVDAGTVSFAFDSDELMAKILRLLQARAD